MTQWCYGLKYLGYIALSDTDYTTMCRDTKSSDTGIVYASILFSRQKSTIAEIAMFKYRPSYFLHLCW